MAAKIQVLSRNLQTAVLEMDPKFALYTDGKKHIVKSIGMFLLANVIRTMADNGDIAFTWISSKNDLMTMSDRDYSVACSQFASKGYHCESGDTTWHYSWTDSKTGRKTKCTMITELYIHKKISNCTSPIAVLMGHLMAPGIHITKCSFEQLE